ncbi:photosynthetic NDH subunit of lumenal location 1 [Populus alba x Populus x berolinensis]|nr:photosynthetic NDH subunit of lumenal location 1 [Populus alba x Populus x berolinensis]
MAIASLSLSWASTTLSQKLSVPGSNEILPRVAAFSGNNSVTCTAEATFNEESNCKRRLLLLGVGALTTSLVPANFLFAEEIPKNYTSFVDFEDGYSYYYPSDWIDFDFRGHDSAFKDRTKQLQNVRVRFIPTEKKDIHELGPMEEAIYFLVKHRYAAPNQMPTIYSMQETLSMLADFLLPAQKILTCSLLRKSITCHSSVKYDSHMQQEIMNVKLSSFLENQKTVEGKNYYTFEYELTSPNYSSVSFAIIVIANGRFYTLIVGANERRWRRYRSQLKVVADSFKVLDI